jgi:heptosyltransferase-2
MNNRILIIQTAFLGDALLTLPLIQYVKTINKKNIIDVVCIPSTKEIFKASSSVNSVFVLEKRGKHKSLKSFLSFAKELKKNSYTKIISPHRSFRTSLLVWFLNVKEAVGFDKSSMSFIYSKKITHNWSDHEVLRNLKLADFSGSDWRIKPNISIPENTKEKIKRLVAENNLKNFIMIAPGSVWNTKAYPIELYRIVVEYFIGKDFKVVLIGGKNEFEICDLLAKDFNDKVVNFSGKLSIIESIEFMKYSKILICNDSAPTHMGMAADISVLTVYCSTVPSFGFYPYNEKSRYLSYDELKCKPCGIHGKQSCPIKTFECAYKLTPGTIIDTAVKMIS